MNKQKHNKRLLGLALSMEHRLKKFPSLIRREFRASANRQVNALAKLDRALDILSRESERQRREIERLLAED